MVYYLLKYLVRIFSKIYFKEVIIFGMEHLEQDKPLILAANHPSAFVEPCLIGAYFPIEVHFMTRGDFFIPPFVWFFNGTNQIPIYRMRDGIKNLRKNEQSFAKAYEVLREGGRVTIFPEATTRDVKRIRRLKDGASRLVVGAYEKTGVIPYINGVVTNYENLHRWRSYVFLSISEPIKPEKFLKESGNSLKEMTELTAERMKSGAIHIARDKDDEWVNVILQTATEEWRAARLPLTKIQLFKHLQEIAAVSEYDDTEKEELHKNAQEILELNMKSKTDIGVPVISLSMRDYLVFILLGVISLPAILYVFIPVGIARLLIRRFKLDREFKIPVFLGVILVLSVIGFIMLLILLILKPDNWLMWAYLLILPLSLYSLGKLGDVFQKIRNARRLRRLSQENLSRYTELRKCLLNYFYYDGSI